MTDQLPDVDADLLPRTLERIREGARYGLDIRLTSPQARAVRDELDRLAGERDRACQLWDDERRRSRADYEVLFAERDRLARQVQRVRAWADKMEAEAPMPGPGGFFAVEVRRVLDGETTP